MPSYSERDSYYKLLGITTRTGQADICEAYRKKALRCHRSKRSAQRLKYFVELTVAFAFMESYSELSAAAFELYKDQWFNVEKFQAEHKAAKLAHLSNRDFVRSEFYHELLEDSDDIALVVAGIGVCLTLALPLVLYWWKGTAGAVIGGIITFIVCIPLLPYLKGSKEFRFSRFIGHLDLMLNQPATLPFLVLLVNGVFIPFILFRFAIPWYIIPLVYIVTIAGFVVIGRTYLNHKSALFAKQFVWLGAPSFVTVFFLLNTPSLRPIVEESYAFVPKVEYIGDEWGRNREGTTTMIQLENGAYGSAVGLRIFMDQEGFENDTITYRMSRSLIGLKYARSWEFH